MIVNRVLTSILMDYFNNGEWSVYYQSQIMIVNSEDGYIWIVNGYIMIGNSE